jgi:hypothetical protein
MAQKETMMVGVVVGQLAPASKPKTTEVNNQQLGISSRLSNQHRHVRKAVMTIRKEKVYAVERTAHDKQNKHGLGRQGSGERRAD